MECPTHFWAEILWCRGFDDVPRLFCIAVRGGYAVFDSSFNDELDDYEPTYSVKLVRNENEDVTRAAAIGEVAVATVLFDPTLRRSAAVPRALGSLILANG